MEEPEATPAERHLRRWTSAPGSGREELMDLATSPRVV